MARPRAIARKGRRGAGWVTLVCLLSAGCSAPLPEPDSPGAQLYAQRCTSCHRSYAPGSMKFEMWKLSVQRMQGEMARHGLPPLTAAEEALLLDYLKKHSG